MLPATIACEDCGSSAKVRGYGRVEYQWQGDGDGLTELHVSSIRLTIDCPICGVTIQDHHPDNSPTPQVSRPS